MTSKGQRAIAVALSTAAMATAVVAGTIAPASAAGNCAGRQLFLEEPRLNAFAGHSIRATFKMCYIYPEPTRRVFIAGSTTPVVSFPSILPAGAGESVDMARAPYPIRADKWKHVYRFTVKQGPVYVPVKQTFDFDIELNSVGGSRICFVGRACGTWA